MNTCLTCGSAAVRKDHRYCSHACYIDSRRGKPRTDLSPEARARMADSKRGDLSPMRRPEVARKRSETQRRNGLTVGPLNANWKGGLLYRGDGRVLVNVGPNKYRRRAHLVWEATHPDDPILSGQIVHHVNGDEADDRPENLMKLSNQREHALIHKIGGQRWQYPGGRKPI